MSLKKQKGTGKRNINDQNGGFGIKFEFPKHSTVVSQVIGEYQVMVQISQIGIPDLFTQFMIDPLSPFYTYGMAKGGYHLFLHAFNTHPTFPIDFLRLVNSNKEVDEEQSLFEVASLYGEFSTSSTKTLVLKLTGQFTFWFRFSLDDIYKNDFEKEEEFFEFFNKIVVVRHRASGKYQRVSANDLYLSNDYFQIDKSFQNGLAVFMDVDKNESLALPWDVLQVNVFAVGCLSPLKTLLISNNRSYDKPDDKIEFLNKNPYKATFSDLYSYLHYRTVATRWEDGFKSRLTSLTSHVDYADSDFLMPLSKFCKGRLGTFRSMMVHIKLPIQYSVEIIDSKTQKILYGINVPEFKTLKDIESDLAIKFLHQIVAGQVVDLPLHYRVEPILHYGTDCQCLLTNETSILLGTIKFLGTTKF